MEAGPERSCSDPIGGPGKLVENKLFCGEQVENLDAGTVLTQNDSDYLRKKKGRRTDSEESSSIEVQEKFLNSSYQDILIQTIEWS